MSSTYISPTLRRMVRERAAERCEYCRYPQAMALLPFEGEHIVAEKHGGATVFDNLALACPYCNRFKSTDLGSLDPETDHLTPFFNPRTQQWADHFQLDDAQIRPLTPQGRVTVAIFRMNHEDRIIERQQLIELGLLP